MDFSKLQQAVYAASWVDNYLQAMVADKPEHKALLENYTLVYEALEELRRSNTTLATKLTDIQAALNG